MFAIEYTRYGQTNRPDYMRLDLAKMAARRFAALADNGRADVLDVHTGIILVTVTNSICAPMRMEK